MTYPQKVRQLAIVWGKASVRRAERIGRRDDRARAMWYRGHAALMRAIVLESMERDHIPHRSLREAA